jgi:glycine C-acetyltransferase
MFSTAMTPQATGSLIEAINVIETEPIHRERLWENIKYFRKNLIEIGFDLGNAATAIFPIIIGNDYKVKELCRLMHDEDIYVNPVLYPAVPKRTTRIRMSLMSTHKKEHLDKALNVLEYASKKMGIIGEYKDNIG